MPDIRSALEKALAQTANAWAADDEAHQTIQPPKEQAVKQPRQYFQTTNNVTRITFDFVRDNPGWTRVEITKELEKKGFKSKSVASLLGQMLRQGMMRERDKLLYTNSNEYTPIKSTKVARARVENPVHKQKPPTTERKHVEIINTRTGEIVNPKPERPWETSDVIDKLTVRQAMAVYGELRNIFGA